uniref:Putative transposon protein n=1 Tax=Oryza sativa subsp. indica TaxID=39946 RepID=A0A8F3ADP3_ORYSI|nr:putative transposon protein [Oryza sativa Indica Group]
MKFHRGGTGLYRGEAKIALPQGGKGAACKIPCPLAAHLQAAPRTVQNRPSGGRQGGRLQNSMPPSPPICRRPPAQYKIALAEGGKGAACKIPCPPLAAHLQAAPAQYKIALAEGGKGAACKFR